MLLFTLLVHQNEQTRFLKESYDLFIGSTETKYIKLNAKTQFLKNNIRLLYTL